MMRKIIQKKPVMTILILLFIFCMILTGCSNNANANAESEANSKADTATSSNMVKSSDSVSSTASGSNAESMSDSKVPSQNYSINISEDEAIKLALTEAKSHQKEFLCTITDADIKTAKYELKSDNNNIRIVVADNANGMTDSQIESLNNHLSNIQNSNKQYGIGTQNVNNRIKIAYGESYGLTFKKESTHIIAEILIPAIYKKGE